MRLIARPGTGLRKFTLLDGLVMIVPIAAALALSRPFLANYPSTVPNVNQLPPWLRRAGIGLGVTSRLVAMAMLGVLAARLRQPRPSFRRVSQQPGAVACAAAAGAMSAGGPIAISMAIFRSRGFGYAQDYWPWAEAMILPAVLTSWLMLAIGRRWRAEPGWIDRMGRILGAYWFVMALIQLGLSFYSTAQWTGYP